MTVCTTAQDKKGTASLQVGSITTLGAGEAASDSAQNVFARLTANWEKSGDGVITAHAANFYVFRVAPTSADYTNAPIGSIGILLLADSTHTPVIYTAAMYVKTVNGWEKINTSLTAPSHVIIAGGLHNTVGGGTTETITVSGATIGDMPFVNIVSVGTVGGYVAGATISSAGFITVTMSADQKVSCKLGYRVIRAVSA